MAQDRYDRLAAMAHLAASMPEGFTLSPSETTLMFGKVNELCAGRTIWFTPKMAAALATLLFGLAAAAVIENDINPRRNA